MKILCKLSAESECPHGLNICCGICDEVTTCKYSCTSHHAIGFGDPEDCEDAEVINDELIAFQSSVPEALRIITEITIQKQKLDEQEKQMKKIILESMEKYGVKKFENEQVCFTYVAPTIRTSVDSTKLKKKYPDIAEECSKTSNVSASVRISVK
jgi:hypothetical protein